MSRHSEVVKLVGAEIWSQLVAASTVEAPSNVQPYYNGIVKIHEKKQDYKRPSEMTVDEYLSFTPKPIWGHSVKFSTFSISCDTSVLIRFFDLLVLTAVRLEVFEVDGKVDPNSCELAANVVNYILESNRVFFPVILGGVQVTSKVIVNRAKFLDAVRNIVRVIYGGVSRSHYMEDDAGKDSPKSPTAEILFYSCLHELKGLVESWEYLINSYSYADREQNVQLSLDDIRVPSNNATTIAAGSIASTAIASTSLTTTKRHAITTAVGPIASAAIVSSSATSTKLSVIGIPAAHATITAAGSIASIATSSTCLTSTEESITKSNSRKRPPLVGSVNDKTAQKSRGNCAV